MTQPLTPGQQLLADTESLTPGSPLAAADSVASRIIDEIGGSASLLSADLDLKTPSAAAPSEDPMTAEAVVTAVLPGRGTTLRTEVTAHLAGGGVDGSVLRFAFASEPDDSATVSGLLCPAGKEWNAELRTRLSADEEFARLIETYDGTIGLSIGARPVHIRCYRGQVLEVVSRAVKGADFVLDIPGEVFIDLMTSQQNTFMETAMLGRMKSSGSGYEYLRMTSALIRIVDHARGLAAAAGYAGAHTSADERTEVA
ncbi:hypothetical protein [Brevibacterium marinum]|uniref:Uncharacterized protein n=1 Tax=Brevibacterium marinum TaxID=418643 RepID=A0A846RWI2_9MICO|nr:hypothetical protein [Brevibacterium marinum]NJC58584.1 hypothetical protein [Brevibacterium marinum]